MDRATLRKRKGMTQAELGAAVGVNRCMISKWEHGSPTTLATLDRICTAVDASPLDMARMLRLGAGGELTGALAVTDEEKAAA